MKEQLKTIKTTLMGQVQAQMGNLDKVNAKELGEVVDMIKDLTEAEYYCSIVDAMEKKENGSTEVAYFREYPIYRDIDRYSGGRMYYNESNSSSGGNSGGRNYSDGNSGGRNYSDGNNGGRRNFHDEMMPYYLRDIREGRSPEARRNYMESKEMHQDKAVQMQELDTYMKELSTDITEMIVSATPDEKALLREKMTTLVNKIK